MPFDRLTASPTPSDLPAAHPLHAALLIRPLSDRATIPAYQSELAAGLDLAACLPITDDATTPFIDLIPIIRGGLPTLIPCGFAMALQPGFEAQVRPRSGLATKFGISMPNAPGTIDADYRGEVKCILINLGEEPFVIEPGMRIAQMVVAPVTMSAIEVVTSVSATARGAGGFGSTGVAAR